MIYPFVKRRRRIKFDIAVACQKENLFNRLFRQLYQISLTPHLHIKQYSMSKPMPPPRDSSKDLAEKLALRNPAEQSTRARKPREPTPSPAGTAHNTGFIESMQVTPASP